MVIVWMGFVTAGRTMVTPAMIAALPGVQETAWGTANVTRKQANVRVNRRTRAWHASYGFAIRIAEPWDCVFSLACTKILPQEKTGNTTSASVCRESPVVLAKAWRRAQKTVMGTVTAIWEYAIVTRDGKETHAVSRTAPTCAPTTASADKENAFVTWGGLVRTVR